MCGMYPALLRSGIAIYMTDSLHICVHRATRASATVDRRQGESSLGWGGSAGTDGLGFAPFLQAPRTSAPLFPLGFPVPSSPAVQSRPRVGAVGLFLARGLLSAPARTFWSRRTGPWALSRPWADREGKKLQQRPIAVAADGDDEDDGALGPTEERAPRIPVHQLAGDCARRSVLFVMDLRPLYYLLLLLCSAADCMADSQRTGTVEHGRLDWI